MTLPNFDTELFIDEVEKRPAIWNMESSKILRRRAWKELVLIFSDNDDSDEKKKRLSNSPQKKWKGLRDTFVREKKKTKKTPSGSGTSKIHQRLMFLEKSIRSKTTESNIQDTSESSEAGNEKSVDDDDCLKIRASASGSWNEQQPQISCVTEDDEKLFCLFLYTELLKVPEANRMALKIKLMKILQAGQQLSQPTPCSNSSYSFDNLASSSNSSASSVSFPVRPSYHTLQVPCILRPQPNEFAFQDYDPTKPSLNARDSTSTPLRTTSPSASSRDSQGIECMEFFPNDDIF